MTELIVALLLLLVGVFIVRWALGVLTYGQGIWWGDLARWLPSGLVPPNWKAANQRAEALLAKFVTAEEWQALQSTGYLSVPSPSHPGRVYHIPRRPGLIRVYQSDRPVFQLCVHPRKRLPSADLILLHKLMIEADERRYLGIANSSSITVRR